MINADLNPENTIVVKSLVITDETAIFHPKICRRVDCGQSYTKAKGKENEFGFWFNCKCGTSMLLLHGRYTKI